MTETSKSIHFSICSLPTNHDTVSMSINVQRFPLEYLGESERWSCWGELQVLVLVGVSRVQDERNHIILPGLDFHGYCGLRRVHSYPAQENSFLKDPTWHQTSGKC